MGSNTQIEALQKIKAITEEKYLDIKTAVRLVGWLDRQREKISEIATEALASYNKSNEEGDKEYWLDLIEKAIEYGADNVMVFINTEDQIETLTDNFKKLHHL